MRTMTQFMYSIIRNGTYGKYYDSLLYDGKNVLVVCDRSVAYFANPVIKVIVLYEPGTSNQVKQEGLPATLMTRIPDENKKEITDLVREHFIHLRDWPVRFEN